MKKVGITLLFLVLNEHKNSKKHQISEFFKRPTDTTKKWVLGDFLSSPPVLLTKLSTNTIRVKRSEEDEDEDDDEDEDEQKCLRIG